MTDINNINCNSIVDKATRQVLVNKWEMILTPYCLESFQQFVMPYIEMEMMQGSQCALPDGRTQYNFVLDDEKSQAMKQALFNVIAKPKMN